MLRDRGLVDAERWRSEEMGELPVPTSVQGLISSRLDRLEGGDKQLAHNAAVVGAVFWAGAVAHLGADEGVPLYPIPTRDWRRSSVGTSSFTATSRRSRARTSTRSSTS